MRLFLLFFLLLFSFPSHAEKGPLFDDKGLPLDYIVAYVVESAPNKDYEFLRKKAEGVAAKTGLKFETLDRVYDAEKGMIYPKNYEHDEAYAGGYLPRRDVDNTPSRISIEMRQFYHGDKKEKDPLNMMLVFGIFSSKKEAVELASTLEPHVATVHVHKVDQFYMGCMH